MLPRIDFTPFNTYYRGMKMHCRAVLCLIASLTELVSQPGLQASTFQVATYNLDGYVQEPRSGRAPKTPESRNAVHATILAARPDVIALQEVGDARALGELQNSLKAGGLDLPHREFLNGPDTNTHLAILSRFPFVARRAYTNEAFLLGRRRFRVSRGFCEVDVQVNPAYCFTLLTAHLKSRRPVPMANEAEQRLQEAKLLREKIDACLASRPEANLVVLGDLNDTPASTSTKIVIGRGKTELVDTRPVEVQSGEALNPGTTSGEAAWTYHYAKEDTYSRIDYLLLSRGMAREWVKGKTHVLANKNWAVASDHRLLMATFEAEEK